MSAPVSLELGFDATRTQAVLRAAPEYRAALAQMLARFPSGRMTDWLSAAIPVDGFVAGISELGTWPHPEGVVWEDSFSALVGELLDTAEAAEQLLSGQAPGGSVDADDVLSLLGASWRGDLTAFQRRDAARLLAIGHGANFSVPGAGKTRVALAVFAALRERKHVSRLLVVSPKSAYEAWQEESGLCFAEPLDVRVMEKHPSTAADLLIVNYERLDRSLAALSEWLKAGPAMLVLDEAHRMKLGGAGVYGAACLALGPLSRTRMILTGTPAPNGAKDMENLLSFVWPGHGRRVVRQAVDGGSLADASRVLRPLYTRTTKHELGLPPVRTRMRMIPMPSLHREIYDAMAGQFSARAEAVRSDIDSLGKSALRMLMAATSPALLVAGTSRYEPLDIRVPPLEVPESGPLSALLRRLTEYEIPPKYGEVLSIVAANAAEGRKTLVWAGFVRSLTTLESLLQGFQPAVVHGGTPDREEQIRRFREDPDCAVLLSNPATLGEGISLHQVCHDAVYVDRDFQAGRYMQSLDRIHRLGLAPDTETRITILASAGTIDEVVALRLAEKLEFLGRILDDPAVRKLGDPEDEPATAAGMDEDDLRAILSHIGTGTEGRPDAFVP
ncbi:DEAD/DEAH box helicase [Streptomyces uncialis]|uniref:DEAD/DEAH box helicase n=1 Tax=Streptomyces uncialis TaxID=1048205 RepID=UPI00224D2235|nr:DEAD/DEAH box helicase [Streptomyces uncialis]MCX4661264.1 DEAD/DEAH box helicase [Streptomyces uncialis]